MKHMKELIKYDIIHNNIVELINTNRDNELLNLMEIYNHTDSNRGMLRTILMALKPIIKSQNNKIQESYKNLGDILRKGSTHGII